MIALSEGFNVRMSVVKPPQKSSKMISRRSLIASTPFLLTKKANAETNKCYSEEELIQFGFESCILYGIIFLLYLQNYFNI